MDNRGRDIFGITWNFYSLIPVHPCIQTAIASLVHQNRWGSALLITGHHRLSRLAAIQYLVGSLFCQTPPCQTCMTCSRLRNHTHPDVIVVPSVPKPTVERVRMLINQIQYGPSEASNLACIISDANSLNDAASNALLKSIEEPPKGVVFMIGCDNPTQVLPTIQSRCMTMYIPPIADTAALVAYLNLELPDGCSDDISIDHFLETGEFHSFDWPLVKLNKCSSAEWDQIVADISGSKPRAKVVLRQWLNECAEFPDLKKRVAIGSVLLKTIQTLDYNINLSLQMTVALDEIRSAFR